jgi:Na+-transporting NADH:ubiquinone oxidoreductase subunit NqrD
MSAFGIIMGTITAFFVAIDMLVVRYAFNQSATLAVAVGLVVAVWFITVDLAEIRKNLRNRDH